MKRLLTLAIVMILAAAVIPAGAQVDGGPYPQPTGHAIGDGPEGSGARIEIITRPDVKASKPPRPTPAPTAYPAPELEAQAQAYPPPGEGLPGITGFEPDPDDPEPRFGIPYVWGPFFDNDGWRKVFVSIELGYPAFDMVGGVCIMSTAAPYPVTCYDLHPHRYADGITMYKSDKINLCGTFVIQAAALDQIPADIRLPNLYPLRCIFIPWVRRFWY